MTMLAVLAAGFIWLTWRRLNRVSPGRRR